MNRYFLLLQIIFISFIFSQINALENIKNNYQKISSLDNKNINRAKSHERAGLIDEAEVIYDQLFAQYPNNKYIFSAFKSFLNKQKKWSRLIEISTIYSKASYPSPFGKLELADSYLIINEDNKAFSILNDLFEEYSYDEEKLKRFLSKIIRHNKIEFAYNIILKIRKDINRLDFYSRELGAYYYSKMDFSKALKAYILYLNNNINDIKYVRMKLMSFPQDDETKIQIKDILTEKKSKVTNRILAEYEFKWGNYENAYNLIINNFFNEEEVYEFGINMMTTGKLLYAEKIFTKLSESNNNKIAELSIYQLANIFEIYSTEDIIVLPISDDIVTNTFFDLVPFMSYSNKIQKENIVQSIMMYDSLSSHFNNSQAKFKLINLKYKFNQNEKDAIKSFNEIIGSTKDYELAFKCAIKIIDLMIVDGQVSNDLLQQINDYKKVFKKNNQQTLIKLK